MKRFLLAFLIIFCSTLFTQEKKVGIALSGGGAKGFAHIGVLKVLEEIEFPIDYISGVSMGSIVGGLYSIGYSAEELEQIVNSVDWENIFNDSANRRELIIDEKNNFERYIAELPIVDWEMKLPTGLIRGQKVTELLNHYTWFADSEKDFRKFKIPFSCVATNLKDGKAVKLTFGKLSEAMRASMGIPTVFTPVITDDYILADGFLSRNLPAIDVKEMGADLVIGIDVGEEVLAKDKIESFMDVLNQTISYQGAYADMEQRKLCDLVITPELEKYGSGSFNSAEELIKLGEDAARKMIPQLLKIKNELLNNRNKIEHKIDEIPDSLMISDIIIDGNEKISDSFIYSQGGIYSSGYYKVSEIEKAVDRLFSSDYFKKVTFRILKRGRKNILAFYVDEKNEDLFRFGMNFNSIDKTSLLLNIKLKNIWGNDSKFIADLKLTSNWKFNLSYTIPLGIIEYAGLKLSYHASKDYLDIFYQDQHALRFNNYINSFEIYTGTFYSKVIDWGVGLKFEDQNNELKIGPAVDENIDEGRFIHLFSSMYLDTFDKTEFPTSGTSLKIKGEWIYALSDVPYHENGKFRLIGDWQSAIPVYNKTSLFLRAQLGYSTLTGEEYYYQFSLGGIDNFPGLEKGELLGTQYLNIHFGGQYEIFPHKYINVRWNIGKTSNKWKMLFDKEHEYISGFLIAFGMESLLGPIEFVMSGSSRNKEEFYFNLGYKF
ncbi:MAG: patatin-like phospholipase family protein [Melioribacteraceae bacterium]|nr:patatin-like phospholipase family protein [Melioribacteraceae bacterium]